MVEATAIAFAMSWLGGFPPYATATSVIAGFTVLWLVVGRARNDRPAAARLALDLLARNADAFEVVALTANSNVEGLAALAVHVQRDGALQQLAGRALGCVHSVEDVLAKRGSDDGCGVNGGNAVHDVRRTVSQMPANPASPVEMVMRTRRRRDSNMSDVPYGR